MRPPLFVPFTHGYDDDYDCLDGASFDASTGERHPVLVTAEDFWGYRLRFVSEYMEATIRYWASHAKKPQKEAVYSIIGPT